MIFTDIMQFISHLDQNLASLAGTYGILIYPLLFLIIFCETGLVVTPFLPGDSLLFAAGAIASQGFVSILLLFFILVIAAILGDTVNYWLGHYFGTRIIKKWHIKQEYLNKTQAFYDKHGGKTIILARFIPIIRTFAPFVAGIGKMDYARFISFNIVGGISWTAIFLFAGYFFGNIPFVKENFTLVIFAIIIISLMPIAIEYIKHKKTHK